MSSGVQSGTRSKQHVAKGVTSTRKAAGGGSLTAGARGMRERWRGLPHFLVPVSTSMSVEPARAIRLSISALDGELVSHTESSSLTTSP